ALMMQSLKLLTAARLVRSAAAQQARLSHHYIRTEAEVKSYENTAKMWSALTFVAALPCLIFGLYNMETREHEFHESHPDGPALPNWEWNKITKPFPWGDGKQPLFEYLFQKHPQVYPPPESDE
ncbi:hypothetical protein BOX15_Mlig011441g9, partial [Macrostomum lignano]